eukprot:g4245.t1
MDSSEDWDTHTTEQGLTYYYNRRTGETTWERPAGAAAPQQSSIGGWEAIWSEEHQMYYYCNRATGAAQWEAPNPAPAQASPQEPPPPYSSEAETLATQGNIGGGVGSNISSSNSVSISDDVGGGGGGVDAITNSPPPYSPHLHLQPSPMTTAPRPGAAVETLNDRVADAAAVVDGGGAGAGAGAALDAAAAAAAAAAAVGRRPPAGARKAAPARPPMEREDSVLKEALSRRKESLRRLEDVRAGARARLAALKAETDARRAAKLAAAAAAAPGPGKGSDAAKVPPPPPPVRRHSGADAIPATAGPAVPEPLLPPPGDRALGPARGGDALEGGAAGDPQQDHGGLGGENGGGMMGAGRDPRRGDAPEAATAVAAAADGGGGRGGRAVGGRFERPTNKRRQVPRRKEAFPKGKDEEENKNGEDKEEEEEEEGSMEAVVAEVPRGDKHEEQEKYPSVAVPPVPALPAEVKNVEGFKALWRETVKVRRVSGSSGDFAAAAKEAVAGEKGARTGAREAGAPGGAAVAPNRPGAAGGPSTTRDEIGDDGDHDVDDGEAEAGWNKIDLAGEEAGDEIAAISTMMSDDHGVVPTARDGSAVRSGDKRPSMLSIRNFTKALGNAIDNSEDTETDNSSEREPSPSSRMLSARREQHQLSAGGGGSAGSPSPTSTAKSGEPFGGGGGGGGSAAAAAAAARAGAGSTQSTEALSPTSAASSSSSSSPPLRAAPCSSRGAPAVNSALGRVLRLRELLSSVGDAKAWARLLGRDAHLGCRRLADLALSSSKTVLLPRKGVSTAAEAGEAAGGSVVHGRRLDGPCRRLCSASLGCLAMCGRISPGVWADLSRADDGLGGGGGDGGGGSSRLTQLLSLALALADNNEAAVARTGLNEHEYFFGKGARDGKVAGTRRRQGGREEGQEEEEEEEEEEEMELPAMGLALIYEVLTGSCKARVEALRRWGGMNGLVESLMNLLAQDKEEEIYMGATRCLLAANDPFLRPSLPAVDAAAAKAAAGAAAAAAVAKKALAAETGAKLGVDDLGFSYGFASFSSVSAPRLSRSTVVPALLGHAARHEVQGAVLHIFNEEGYPNGDAALAKLCLVFCSDAFEDGRDEDLFYVNDLKVLVDIIVRELANLPADDVLRADYNSLLVRLLDQSEWDTRGGRYREKDIKHAMGGER